MTSPTPWPTALTIAGSDSGGGAGLEADLKTFLACRVHGLCAVTAVTVQNSLGVTGVHEIPAETVAAQIEAVASDIGVGATKTGMLASRAIIEAVADVVDRVPLGPFVLDPVCASQLGNPLLAPDAYDALRSLLFPRATLVTPNVYEIRLLVGIEVVTDDDARRAADALLALGARWALVKGGHRDGPEARDLLTDGTEEHWLTAPRLDQPHTHGSGDTLASAITAALSRGRTVPEAVAAGKAFVTRSVADGYPLGAGYGPVGHFWRIQPGE